MDDDKVLILFLECLAIDNKNCSPNSCDDKGKVIEIGNHEELIEAQGFYYQE